MSTKQRPILHILASREGVYEVRVRALADEYGKAERLSGFIQPAVAIIDRAIGDVFGGTVAPHSRQEDVEGGQ